MKKLILIVLILAILVTSCMPGPNSRWVKNRKRAGFFAGLWHGIIIFFSLIKSIFTYTPLYECYNNGFAYNLGFFIGAASLLGGGIKIIF